MMHMALRLGGFGMRWHGVAFRWIAVLMVLAFIALLVIGVALLWHRGAGTFGSARPAMDEALSTIRMRYANGEMTTQEFLEANEALGGAQPSPPVPPPAPPA